MLQISPLQTSPPTLLYLSLGVDRTEHGSILIVEDGDGGAGPVQSAGVVTAGEVIVSPIEGVLLDEDVKEEGGVVWSMIISAGLK